jgi:hypothetical protein
MDAADSLGEAEGERSDEGLHDTTEEASRRDRYDERGMRPGGYRRRIGHLPDASLGRQ